MVQSRYFIIYIFFHLLIFQDQQQGYAHFNNTHYDEFIDLNNGCSKANSTPQDTYDFIEQVIRKKQHTFSFLQSMIFTQEVNK